MYVVCGSTGRVGGRLMSELLSREVAVRAVVRSTDAARMWRSRGAEAAVADLRDRRRLAEACRGSTGLFALLPFDIFAVDSLQYAKDVISSVAGAVIDAGVPHVVMLSSGGADVPEGTGPIRGLHLMEQTLADTPAELTALRPGHFQEKIGDLVETARHTGVYPVFAETADAPVSMVATRDIAELAAASLLSPSGTSEAVDVLGPARTERQAAEILSSRLGRELEVVAVPEAQWTAVLEGAGYPSHTAEQLSELYRADVQGLLAPRGDRRVFGATELTETIAALID